MMLRFLFVALLFAVGAFSDPAILNLKEYKNGTAYDIKYLEEGANLYIASNDAPASLNNIQVTTGGQNYVLSDLATVNPDGTPNKIKISGGLTLTTTNPDAVTNSLTGYLYATTAQQAKDKKNFAVYVITGTHHITISGSPTTTVILNTQLTAQSGEADQPQKSTYVSNVVMQKFADPKANANVNFFWGVPSSGGASQNRFFMNWFEIPIKDIGGNNVTELIWFDNIEPMQVGLDYWYIVSSGDVSMDMKNTYVPNHQYTTTAVSTTGLIVSTNFLYDTHVVNFLADPTHSRTVGTLISAYAPTSSPVSFVFNGTDGSWGQTYDSKTNATQNIQQQTLSPQTFTVSSNDISAGIFYCQYFISSSTDVLTTTTVPPSTGSPSTGGSPFPTVSTTSGPLNTISTAAPISTSGSLVTVTTSGRLPSTSTSGAPSTATPSTSGITATSTAAASQSTVTTVTPNNTISTSAATVSPTTSSTSSISVISSVLMILFALL